MLRDHNGEALLHSRRAFSGTMSEQQASLMAFSWAVEAMKDHKIRCVLMEASSHYIQDVLNHREPTLSTREWFQRTHTSLHSFEYCEISLVPWKCNSLATEIAESVTRDERVQSNVANNGPSWLESRLRQEAVVAT